MKDIGIIILGGTGFGAGELLRILLGHQNSEIVSIVSTSAAGQSIDSAHPHLTSLYENVKFDSAANWEGLKSFKHKILFSALPHGKSGETIHSILKNPQVEGLRIIDLSGDLRIKDENIHKTNYPHSPFFSDLQDKAVYGLTELNREAISSASIVSNPGCLATAAIFALRAISLFDASPLVSLTLSTGSSGAGKDPKASTHHPTRNSNYFAYKSLSHQHEPEVVQAFNSFSSNEIDLQFVAHSLPLVRGILCTAYVQLNAKTDAGEALEKVSTNLKDPFIRVRKSDVQLQNVVGSNFVDIGVAIQDRKMVVFTAIDNLVKGMAGQAIQNMNLMCGLPETIGLWTAPLRPV